MSENLVTNSEAAALHSNPRAISDKLRKGARDLLITLIWLYFLTKLLVFDLDIAFLSAVAPKHVWLLDYKFLFILGFASLLWATSPKRSIFKMVIYIISFPLIVFLWRVPGMILRSGNLTIILSVMNALAAAYTSFKYIFITFTLSLISMIVTLKATSKSLLLLAGLVLLFLIVTAYIRRMILAFKPSIMHQLFMRSFMAARKHGRSVYGIDEKIKAIAVNELDQKQLTTWTQNLQTAVLFNRSCLFVAKKLRDYEKTGVPAVSYVLTIVILMIQTVVSFAFINFALYKFDANQFTTATDSGIFKFFFYSFNNLIFNSTSGIDPSSPLSQIVYMAQTFMILFLAVIFISVIVSEMRHRHSQDLQEAIDAIQEEGLLMEAHICEEYKFNSIEEAMNELIRLKSSMASFIFKLSESLK